jgi:replicative DNA helicase
MSGIDQLDNYTGGTRLGEFTLLYAKPGYGKSSLFLQACFYRALVLNRPQLWLSIGDMTAEQDWFRYIQQETGLDALDQAQGNFKDSHDRWPDIDGYLKRAW